MNTCPATGRKSMCEDGKRIDSLEAGLKATQSELQSIRVNVKQIETERINDRDYTNSISKNMGKLIETIATMNNNQVALTEKIKNGTIVITSLLAVAITVISWQTIKLDNLEEDNSKVKSDIAVIKTQLSFYEIEQ